MDLFYGTQISKNSINEIIKQTQDFIRVKQIIKHELPAKCNSQINNLLSQTLHNTIQKSQQQTMIESCPKPIFNIKIDNRTPSKLMPEKRNSQIIGCSERISFDQKSFRKSSAVKSKREQCTASTNNRKKLTQFSKTFDGTFFEDRPRTQTECRKRMTRTADASSRGNYRQLKDETKEISFEDEARRKQLKQKRKLQKLQHQKAENALIRLSYQRRALQEQFEAAKLGDKNNSFGRKKIVNEIVNYQIQNGSILTNQLRKPFKKTIQNLINLEYDESVTQRILRRKSLRSHQIDNNRKDKALKQKQQQKFILMNKNYNNGNRRQISLIPYVTINPGVSLSQSSIQASISRARPEEQLSREKFFATIENKTFRSYSKDVSPVKSIEKNMATIDVCQKHRVSKSTLNNQTKDSLRRSILWGPKTSRQGHKIRLQKQDFLREFED